MFRPQHLTPRTKSFPANPKISSLEFLANKIFPTALNGKFDSINIVCPQLVELISNEKEE